MAVSFNAGIITKDLVFALDMRNQRKSWLGAPSTNTVQAVTWAGDGSVQAGIPLGAELVSDDSKKYRGLETYLYGPRTGGNCYLNSTDMKTTTTSTVWTFCCFIRREDGQPITSLGCYMYTTAGDGSQPATLVDVGGGWYFVYRTKTIATANYVSLCGFTGLGLNKRYYLSGATCSPTAYPVYPIPTNGTRTTANCVRDLTGNHQVTATSLAYTSTGDPFYSATGEYLAIPADLGYTTQVSAFAWVKLSGVPRGGYHIIFGGTGLELAVPSSTYQVRTGVFIDGIRYVGNHGSSLNDGKWHHIGLTYDGTAIKSYVDGALVNTHSVTGTLNHVVTNRAIGKLGSTDGTYGMNGFIDHVTVYKRALTDNEVVANFNALCGRYGV